MEISPSNYWKLNINSLPSEFEDLKILVKGKVDIIVITESKLGHTFPDSSFRTSGYCKPFRKDRNRNGGGILVFIKDDIPCKELQINFLMNLRFYSLKST